MPQVDPVILQLKADVADYQRDVTRAQKLSEEKLDRIGRAGTATGVALRKGFDLAKGAALAYAGAITVGAVVTAIKTGLDYAASLGEQAQQLGVTTTALQEYRYAGSQAGLTAEEMDQAFSQLTRRLGEAASGTKEQVKAFDTLGISIKDTEGNVIDAGRAIPLIADAMKDIESPAERAALLMDLFGRSGQKLEPLLAGGSAAIDQLRRAAHELGIVLSEDQIQRADETADKLDAIKQVLSARIAGVVADNANSILLLAGAFERLVTSAGNAVTAYQRFKLQQGKIQAELNAKVYGASPLQSDRFKAVGFGLEAKRFDTAIKDLDYPNRKKGGRGGYGGKAAPGLPALAPFTPSAGAVKPSGGGGASVRSGPSAEDIAAQQAAEISRLQQEEIRARVRLTQDANARADLERELLALEFAQRKASIDADKDLSPKQKAAQIEILQRLYGIEGAYKEGEGLIVAGNNSLLAQAIEQDRIAQLKREAGQRERETADLLEEIYRGEQDALRLQYDLADTEAERRSLALQILDAEDAYLKSKLESVIASESAEAAEKERARIALAALDAQAGARRETVERQFEGPLARYGRDAKDTQARVEEAAARRIADLNDTIADTMTKALGIKDPFLRSLLQIFLDQNLFGPIADALSRRSSGGGGLFGAILSGIGAIAGAKSGGLSTDGGLTGGFLRTRASGGYVSGGTMYRVNEGASPGRVEAFVPQGSGNIIPLGRMNAAGGGGGGGGVVRIIVEEGPNFMSTIRTEAAGVAIEVTKQSAGPIIDAAAAETFRRAGRPRI